MYHTHITYVEVHILTDTYIATIWSMIKVVRMDSNEAVGEAKLSSSFTKCLWSEPLAQVLPLNFPHLFTFMRFTASSDFLLSFSVRDSMWIETTTGLPGRAPSFNCWSSLKIAATASSPNKLIPLLADICVNIITPNAFL